MAVEVIHDFTQCEWTDYTSDVYVLDPTAPADSPWRAVTTNRFSKSPSLSPDGTRIAYLQKPAPCTESDIYVTGVAGARRCVSRRRVGGTARAGRLTALASYSHGGVTRTIAR